VGVERHYSRLVAQVSNLLISAAGRL
jgi:hypothetical protein